MFGEFTFREYLLGMFDNIKSLKKTSCVTIESKIFLANY